MRALAGALNIAFMGPSSKVKSRTECEINAIKNEKYAVWLKNILGIFIPGALGDEFLGRNGFSGFRH